ncbi:MAG: Spy/CpxP family protein refolding chaperone [Alphaproteobacteria bacterium]|nr:Spy/CpxP family protein refolding chaperone [Alphaproteobacteria bacterium]
MKKLATLLVSTAVIGGLSLTSFATAASAADSYRGNNRGHFANQQQQTQAPGQNMRGPGMQNDDMRVGAVGGSNGMGANGFAQGGVVRFLCSDNGAPLIEIALNNLSDRLTLSDDQTTLFEAFKTASLTAQTTYADSCATPVADGTTPLDPVELLKLHVTNGTANVAALESVLPSLEALYNSLTDEQKANLLPERGDMRIGQGPFGQFGPGQQGQFNPRGMMDNDDFVPGQGNPQGFSPGNGQGNGPRNNG